jgi:leucyl-tRNA synthetase
LFDAVSLAGEISKENLSALLKLFHPICPHITEELYNSRIEKKLISISSWPKFDESKIDAHLEKIEDIISSLRTDILRVKELAKIESVKKVRLFVSPSWKWDALEIVKVACKERPDFGVAMKALMGNNEMKKHGQEIQTFLKTALNRLPEFMDLKKFDEIKVLNEAKVLLEKEFNSIEIISAENSTEPKAKNAFPGKPALIIE